MIRSTEETFDPANPQRQKFSLYHLSDATAMDPSGPILSASVSRDWTGTSPLTGDGTSKRAHTPMPSTASSTIVHEKGFTTNHILIYNPDTN